MKSASALSASPDTSTAFQEVVERLAARLEGTCADLAVAFVSPHHVESIGRLSAAITKRGLAHHVIGCGGESIVGEGRECEDSPAVSLWAICLPNKSTAHPVRVRFDAGEFQVSEPLRIAPDSNRVMLLLADPFTFPTDRWLDELQQQQPGLRVMGGMASAAGNPGDNRLALDGEVHTEGAIGVVIEGPCSVHAVVSQGCRPIGRPMIVTKADGNLIKELGRRPALEAFRELFSELEPLDQDLVREGLHLGRVINEYQDSFRRGDFLVRNVIGADDDGGLAITDSVKVGQTVQFHVRDAATADEDLRVLLEQCRESMREPPIAALLFNCNGRGRRLFPRENHDVEAIQKAFGPIPLAGFFAMGEIGPIGGRNFVHGFTASVALFCESN